MPSFLVSLFVLALASLLCVAGAAGVGVRTGDAAGVELAPGYGACGLWQDLRLLASFALGFLLMHYVSTSPGARTRIAGGGGSPSPPPPSPPSPRDRKFKLYSYAL